MKTARCLSCDSKIEIGSKAEVGQYVFCNFCGSEFEIMDVNPIELGFAFGSEDFDYEDDDLDADEDEDYLDDYDDDDDDDDDEDDRW